MTAGTSAAVAALRVAQAAWMAAARTILDAADPQLSDEAREVVASVEVALNQIERTLLARRAGGRRG